VEFVREQVIRPVPHRHLDFALPKILRPAFRNRRRLLPKLALCVWKSLSAFIREDTEGNALPAAIVSIQTAGEFLNYHPHLRVWTIARVKTPLPLTSELYFSIFRAFKENGIEIPFPQRDVHLKTVSSSIRGPQEGDE